MLTIDTVATVDRCEQHLEALQGNLAATKDLLLASNLQYAHCGGALALCQVVITWARIHSESGGRLFTHAAGKHEQRTVASLVQTLPGLIGVMMASDVLDRSGSHSLLRDAYEYARVRIEAMDEGRFKDTARGPVGTLVCADHTRKRALNTLYHKGPDGVHYLRGEEDFIELSDALLSTVLGASRRRDLSTEDTETIGVMLRELFANTHVHARIDAMREPYRRSVRGLHFAHHSFTNQTADAVAGDFAPLLEYFGVMLQRPRLSTQKGFLELSVFDSGPGYAARLKGAPIDETDSIDEEYELVRRCLLRNVSTRERSGAGKGLARMLGRLKAHQGFLRLRTGRLSLWKSFAGSEGPLKDDDFYLKDAALGDAGFSRRAPASGAALTLLIPVGR